MAWPVSQSGFAARQRGVAVALAPVLDAVARELDVFAGRAARSRARSGPVAALAERLQPVDARGDRRAACSRSARGRRAPRRSRRCRCRLSAASKRRTARARARRARAPASRASCGRRARRPPSPRGNRHRSGRAAPRRGGRQRQTRPRAKAPRRRWLIFRVRASGKRIRRSVVATLVTRHETTTNAAAFATDAR